MPQPNGDGSEDGGERDEVNRLEARLLPCDVDEGMDALKPMLANLPRATPGDFSAFVSGFRLVVSSYPLWAVKEAVAAFIEGQVPQHTSDYCPNTAQLGRELARRVAPLQARLSLARRQAQDVRVLAAEPERMPRSSEAKALGDAQIERLREEAKADRALRQQAHRTGMNRQTIERLRSEGSL